MNAAGAPKERFFLSIELGEKEKQFQDKESLYEFIGSMFICSRIVIAEEVTETKTIFHVLFGLSSPLQWKNIDASCKESFLSYNVIPLNSFTKGLKYILAVDQVPFFWNYTHAKAIRMLDLMRMKTQYIHLDVPDTGELTKGPTKKNKEKVKEKYKGESNNAAEQAKAPTNEKPLNTTTTPIRKPQEKQ